MLESLHLYSILIVTGDSSASNNAPNDNPLTTVMLFSVLQYNRGVLNKVDVVSSHARASDWLHLFRPTG